MKTFTELVTEIKKGFDKEDNSVLANLEDNIELTSTAALPHAVGTYLVYNKVIYRVTAPIAAGDTLTPGTNITVASDIMAMIATKQDKLTFDNVPTENSNNPVKSGGVFTDEQNIYKVMGSNGAKNLIPNSMKDYSGNGITITVNDDGTFNIDGTVTADMTLESNNAICNGLSIKKGNYKFVTSFTGTKPTGFTRIYYRIGTGSSHSTSWDADTEITITENTTLNVWLYFPIDNSFTFDNQTFSIMLVSTSDTDSTYQPYAKTNRQLTEDVKEIQNQLGVDESNPSILGLQIDFQNKTYTRLAAAAGLSAGSDFDSFPEFGGRKRCNVADDGTVNAYYGASGYSETGSNGQVMVEQPAFYYRVKPLELEKNTTTGIGYHLRKANYYVSHIPYPGFKLHPAFYDKDGNAVSKIYIGAYEACLYDVSGSAYNTTDAQTMDNTADKLSSIANAKPASGLTQDFTRVKAEQMAQNRGTIWHGQTAKTVSVTQLLAMIEYGTPDIQRQIGMGVVSKTDDGSTNMANNTGATSSLGNASGRESGTDGLTSVSYRGEENAWGNLWKFVYGINIWGNGSMGGGEPYICKDFNFAESKNSDNYGGAGFTVTNAGGYISAFGYGKEEYDWLMMCSEASGNDALPVGDYAWLTANLNGYRIARFGATWDSGLKAGLFYWAVSDGVGRRGRDVGARLVCVPTE